MTFHFNRVPKADRRDTMITHPKAGKLVLGLLVLIPLLASVPANAAGNRSTAP